MSDLDPRLVEAREAVATMDPPGDLWARVLDRANDRGAPVHDLRIEPPPRHRSPWLVAAAVAAVIAVGAALLQADDEQPVDTIPATEGSTHTTTAPAVEPVWSGPVREPSDVVQRMAVDGEQSMDVAGQVVFGRKWADPHDASEGWADAVLVRYNPVGQIHWWIELAARPPRAVDLEPGVLIAYGLVLDTTGDGAADYLIGIDNDAPERGDFHVWLTDLATGETDEQIGPPYGFPIEFAHPDERQPWEGQPGGPPPPDPSAPPPMLFTFLHGTAPADLDPATVRFYAWTSTTRDGEVVAYDYAPDTGWITSDAP